MRPIQHLKTRAWGAVIFITDVNLSVKRSQRRDEGGGMRDERQKLGDKMKRRRTAFIPFFLLAPGS